VTGRTIVRLAIVAEGILAALALVWLAARDIPLHWTLDGTLCLFGLTIVLGLLAVNYRLFFGRRGPTSIHPAFDEFATTIVEPLCRALSPCQVIVVALAAGIGEELFFRAALIPELNTVGGPVFAATVSGVIFGWVHFIGTTRRFAPIVAVYILFGIFLGAVYLTVPNIGLLIAIHALYDWLIILIVQRRQRRYPGSSSPSENCGE